jgi:N-methylhydantoinase B
MPLKIIRVGRNEVLKHISAGGGGYGDPAERDPQAVLADVRDGKISHASALAVYGIALDDADPAPQEQPAVRNLELAGR